MAENHTQSSNQCPQSRLVSLIAHTFFTFKAIIVLPCAVVVLQLGSRHWRQQRSSATTSHTDVFTYNAAAFDLIFILGILLYLCGDVSGLPHLTLVGQYISAFTFPGPILLHVLTCLERYLAVVHPVTYLKLRRSGGAQIRNGFLVCIWLLCFCWCAGGPAAINLPYFPTLLLYAFSFVTVTLSSLWVLLVLIRPKLGEGGGANQSRLRAFQTMVVITCTLWMWILGILITDLVGRNSTGLVGCAILMSGYWFTLPSHLVLPLLFLHRAGKLSGCKNAANNNTN